MKVKKMHEHKVVPLDARFLRGQFGLSPVRIDAMKQTWNVDKNKAQFCSTFYYLNIAFKTYSLPVVL